MKLLLDDIEKAQRVTLLVPERSFTQTAGSLEPGLGNLDLFDLRHYQVLFSDVATFKLFGRPQPRKCTTLQTLVGHTS
jgi:hypothetical protein